MDEEKLTADRMTAFSDAVFPVIVTITVLELGHRISRYSRLSGLCGPRPSAICRELPVHCHYLDKPPSLRFEVRLDESERRIERCGDATRARAEPPN